MSEDLGERTASEEAARREEASALEGLKDLQQGCGTVTCEETFS